LTCYLTASGTDRHCRDHATPTPQTYNWSLPRSSHTPLKTTQIVNCHRKQTQTRFTSQRPPGKQTNAVRVDAHPHLFRPPYDIAIRHRRARRATRLSHMFKGRHERTLSGDRLHDGQLLGSRVYRMCRRMRSKWMCQRRGRLHGLGPRLSMLLFLASSPTGSLPTR
jgi:hypothetical protein